jgi:hypothetical protein
MCWRCQQPPHAPCSCEQVEEWKRVSREMLDRYRTQIRWQRRERELLNVRRQQVALIRVVFEREIADMKHQSQREHVEEMNQLRELQCQLGKKDPRVCERKHFHKLSQVDRNRFIEGTQDDHKKFLERFVERKVKYDFAKQERRKR